MRVLLLVTDAFGGYVGIALYNRDPAEAIARMPEVTDVVSADVPCPNAHNSRNSCSPSFSWVGVVQFRLS